MGSLNYRGGHNSRTKYAKDDVVTKNGAAYVAKYDNVVGVLKVPGPRWALLGDSSTWGNISGRLSDQEDVFEAIEEASATGATAEENSIRYSFMLHS